MCEWVRQRVDLYLLSELPPRQMARISEHLGWCLGCRRSLKKMRRHMDECEPAPEWISHVLQRWYIEPAAREREETQPEAPKLRLV